MRYLAASLLILLGLVPASGQVTTATLYGVVRDSTGAVIPDAMVTATHQGTGQTRNGTSDMSGEFALAALPPGPYTLRIQAPGFRTYINEGISLVGGQVTRQTFNMEVGEVTESITVADTVPLLETAQVAQQETLGTREVEELPLARRNLVSLMTLAPGVAEASTGIAGGGNIRLNGVSEGGTLITIDGTDAVGNLETRGANSYGAQNQISVMSIEAVAEVQVVKGILPAEYGSVTGGQVNMISRSGTNSFHGSVFENWQNDVLFARDPFLPLTQKKPDVRFNQFGGSLGGPIVPNRAFFFGAYEGYRETFGVTQQGQVPTQAFRDRILAALPMPETSIVLDTMPLPNEAINANVGLFRDARPRERRDDTFLTKGDVLIGGGNLSVTYSRMRPFTVNPTIYINPGNDQEFDTKQDRVAAQYTLAGPTWVSETRWGYNRNQLDRVNQFWNVVEPGASLPGNETVVGRRIPQMVVQGLFSTPSSEILQLKGRTYTFEQKFSRILGQHNIKAGFRYARVAGSKTNPQNPIISFQNEADLLANVPNGATLEFGIPPHDGNLDEWGGFIQDDWRITPRFVLNMGLRYDYYPTFQVRPTTSRPAEIVNLEAPSNINLLDFGAPRPVDNPYNSDANNFGPRLGFAWTVDEGGTTVVRGGVGVLFSPMMFATIQNTVTDPFVPASLSLNRADVADFGLQWPTYMDDAEAQVRAMAGNEKTLFSLIDPGIRNPYTVQSMLSVQRSFGGSWVVEAGYLRTDGQNFPLHRFFAQAFDRVTGDRPNPALGTPGGYYITGDQTMVYNALQTSLRKQFASGLSFDVHYTLSRGRADQGGGLSSAFVNSDIVATQDFFDPFFDRTEVSQNPLHRVAANVIYELPWLRDAGGFTGALLGGWRVSSIVNARTGRPRVITQPSGIPRSRPDRVGTAVLDDYRETLQYFDRAAFVPVPTSPVSGATLRPGNANAADVRDPGFWQVDMSAGKNFRFTERVGLEVRLDAFNAFNHVNFNPPNGNINSPIFGRLTSVVGMRTAQIAARLAF